MEAGKKNLRHTIIISALLLCMFSCSSRQYAMNSFEKYATNTPVEDSVLLSLQHQNDIVIAYAVDNTAWSKSSTYQIIAKSKDEWSGYYYFVNHSAPGSNFNINPVMVSKESCDSLWQYMQQNEVWKIKGDQNGNFCSNAGSNCNINDGQTWHLMVITKSKTSQSSFYEPAFYEGCCPGNADRKLFINTAYKIQHLVSESGGGR